MHLIKKYLKWMFFNVLKYQEVQRTHVVNSVFNLYIHDTFSKIIKIYYKVNNNIILKKIVSVLE